jgi:aldose 1-epimerase
MNIVELRDAESSSHARIAVNLGFNCFEFVARLADGRVVSVIDAAEGFENGDKPLSHSGIPLLFPYPNRIRGGRFGWNGIDYYLPEGQVAYEGNGNAIHGFCLDRPWRIREQSANSVLAEFQLSVDAPERLALWPADCRIAVRYTLQADALRSQITVDNPSDVPLPWGFGTHAYFRLPLLEGGDPGQCTAYAPVEHTWVLQDCLPNGQIEPAPAVQLNRPVVYAGLKLDDVYTAVKTEQDGFACRIGDPAAGLEVVQQCSPDFREIVAFTPPWTTAVCLEPYTCTTDAINLQQRGVDAGLAVLEPGASWSGSIDIVVRAI